MSLLAEGLAVGGDLLVDLVRTAVLAAAAATTGAVAGVVHRWYAGERVPDGLAVLVGLSVVAIYLNTAGALGEVIGGELELLAIEAVVFNTGTFLVAGLAAVAGGRIGDRIGEGLFAISGATDLDRDVTRIVRTVGRVTTVELPEEISDIDGYDPVDAATKAKLSGHVLVFPRRLTVGDLRTRFVERLRTDYGVGHVDVDFADDGTIEYLALGGRESGIGSTLPPGSAAVAVRADPPNNASPGDAVQVWTTPGPEPGGSTGVTPAPDPAPDADADPSPNANTTPEPTPEADAPGAPAETEPTAGTGAAAGTGVTTGANEPPRRVANAEIRGTADDIVTLAVDESDAKRLETDRRYRLVTLPVESRADRAFAAQLRAAEETMGVVSVAEGSVLAGSPIGALDVAVVAVRAVDGEVVAIPIRAREIAAGETIYAIARPDRLRKLETAAAAAPGGETAGTDPDSDIDADAGDDPASEGTTRE